MNLEQSKDTVKSKEYDFLRTDKNQPIGRRGSFDGFESHFPAHFKGNRSMGKRHLATKWHDGK